MRMSFNWLTCLRRAIVAKNWPILRRNQSSYRRQIELAIERDDAVSVHHRVTALVASLRGTDQGRHDRRTQSCPPDEIEAFTRVIGMAVKRNTRPEALRDGHWHLCPAHALPRGARHRR